MARNFGVCFGLVVLAVALGFADAQMGARIDFPPAISGYNLLFKSSNSDACGLTGFDYASVGANANSSAVLTAAPGKYANLTLAVFSVEGNGPYRINFSSSGEPSNWTTVDTILNVPGDKSPIGPVPAGISYPFSFNVVFRVPENTKCPANGCLLSMSNDNGVVSCARLFIVAGYQSAFPITSGFFKNQVSKNSGDKVPDIVLGWKSLDINTPNMINPIKINATAVPAKNLSIVNSPTVAEALKKKLRSRFETLFKIFKLIKVDAGILYKHMDVLRSVAILVLQF